MNTQQNTAGPSRVSYLAGALFCGCYLAWQATFALSCFAAAYGCDLTWTMYLGRTENPKIYIVWQSGDETLLDKAKGIDGVGRLLGGKVDDARFVPPYFCEHFPEAKEIRLAYVNSGSEETYPC